MAAVSSGIPFGLSAASAAGSAAAAATGTDGRRYHTVVPAGCKVPFNVDVRYSNLKYLGGGAYGCVASAEDTLTGKKVAIKLVRDVFRDLFDAKRILRELILLRHLGRGHENLLWLSDIMVSPPNRHFKDLYIVADVMETDLARILESRQVLTDSHVKYFVYQILRGLKYLHTAGVIHRDLKPQNLLVNASCELVVADLGLARPMSSFLSRESSGTGSAATGAAGGAGDGAAARPRRDSLRLPDDAPAPAAGAAAAGKGGASSGSGLGERAGAGGGADLTLYVVTRWYRAPELLLNCSTYGLAVDMWSVGCILAEMLGRRVLFPGRNYVDQLRVILDVIGTPPEEQLGWLSGLEAARTLRALPPRRRVPWSRLYPTANPLALDLLDKLLSFDPTRRPSVAEALAHPYLADYADPGDEPAAEPLPAVDWGFDARETVTRVELAGLMLAEMAHFRPGFGAGGVGARPKSARMAAHASAAVAAASAAASAAAAAVGEAAAYLAAGTGAAAAGAGGASGAKHSSGVAVAPQGVPPRPAPAQATSAAAAAQHAVDATAGVRRLSGTAVPAAPPLQATYSGLGASAIAGMHRPSFTAPGPAPARPVVAAPALPAPAHQAATAAPAAASAGAGINTAAAAGAGGSSWLGPSATAAVAGLSSAATVPAPAAPAATVPAASLPNASASAAAAAVAPSAGVAVSQVAAPAGSMSSAAAGAATSAASGGAAAAAGAGAGAGAGNASVLQALLGEMRALRGDILGAVDRRIGDAETALAASVTTTVAATLARVIDERVAAALDPLRGRLDRLERAVAAAVTAPPQALSQVAGGSNATATNTMAAAVIAAAV